MIAVGTQAPDFVLKDQNGNEVRLSDSKGKKVLLSFRPLAWTRVCHDQMYSLESHFDKFKALNAVAFGIGVDSSPSNKAWADSMGIKKTQLLADFWPHGEVARKFDTFREKDGFSERSNILIDEKGKVIFTKVYPTSQLPDIEEVIQFLEK
jgi:peroxiredoxin